MLFGWRKRNEGFEWREYVRTTILVRRADRQKRLDDARLAALANVRDVKDQAVNAGRAKIDAAAAAGQQAGQAVANAALLGAAKAADGVKVAAGAAAAAARAIPKPEAPTLLKRAASDAAMYAADLPRRWRLLKPYLLPVAGGAAAIFVFGAALSPQNSGLITGAPADTGAASSGITTGSVSGGDIVLSGRATAEGGDLLRINGKVVKLAGIEAPEPAQACLKESGRRWDCAPAARAALRKLVRGKMVSCELGEGISGAPLTAHCRAAGNDIAAALVQQGSVFAAEGGPYLADEDTAKSLKRGVWQGTAERPSVWRNKVWEEAKKSAPDGCPIKGLMRKNGPIYAMPWSKGYEERDLRNSKGDRWFCSEDEALAAGFKPLS